MSYLLSHSYSSSPLGLPEVSPTKENQIVPVVFHMPSFIIWRNLPVFLLQYLFMPGDSFVKEKSNMIFMSQCGDLNLFHGLWQPRKLLHFPLRVHWREEGDTREKPVSPCVNMQAKRFKMARIFSSGNKLYAQIQVHGTLKLLRPLLGNTMFSPIPSSQRGQAVFTFSL